MKQVSNSKSNGGKISISKLRAKALRLGWKPVEICGTINLRYELSKKDDIKTTVFPIHKK
ncbi:hypothetical protein [Arachidicoccus sp.]|uniref:hypothetical protein n=1 Tax=Arachidicoccus sp. TaxID=1872624 RepID=UPI003D19BD58